ncbi:MAG: hypothetical protein H6640_07705 [Caldilineaceae bacterium]|nr:hypothetical protein [Caldilineaceae bacterium]
MRELDAHRGVLIRGVSGIGKSELARKAHAGWPSVAGWMRADATLRRWPKRSATDVRVAVALAIGVGPDQLPQDGDQANDWLAQQLPRRSLLVLDEAENAVEAAAARRARPDGAAGAGREPPAADRHLAERCGQSRPARLCRAAHAQRRRRPACSCSVRAGWMAPTWRGSTARTWPRRSTLSTARARAIEFSLGAEWRYRHDADFSGLIADLHRHRDRILRDPHYPDEVKSVTLGVQLAYDRLAQRSLDAAALFADLSLFPGGLNEAGALALYGAAAPRLLRMIEDQSLLERPYPDLFYLPTPFRHFAERQLTGGAAAHSNDWACRRLPFTKIGSKRSIAGCRVAAMPWGAVAARASC